MAERNPSSGVEQDPQDDNASNPSSSTKNKIDVSKIDTDSMKTFKKLLQEKYISTDVNILVIGRTGQGKSALINSLIELGRKIVPEGPRSARCTMKSQSYTYPNIIPDVNVTIIDSPGLQDTQNKEHKYIQEMKNECSEISLVLYCIKMTDHKFTNDDRVAIKKLHQVFGQEIWERVVFVLTFANLEPLDKWDERDKDDKSEEPDEEDEDAWKELRKKRLAGRVQLCKKELNTTVNELLLSLDSGRHQEAAQNIKFEVLPAGYYVPKHDCALSGVNWQHNLIALCCDTAKHKQKLKLNKKIYLAVIIDNRGKVKVENEERILNDEAAALKKAFEDLKFAVLYFNSLSSESIATLLEAISKADHSQLLMIALVFLSKGKTSELYDADGVAMLYAAVFDHFSECPIPVIFFFDSANGDIQKKKNSTANETPNASDDDVENENDSTDDDISNENEDDVLLQSKNDSAIDDIGVQNSIADNTPDISLAPLNCPKNSLVLAATHNSASSPVVKEFTEKLSHTSVQECFETICANNNSTTVKSIWHDTVGDNLFIVKSTNDSIETHKQKLEVYHSIWYPVRCKTIDKLEESRGGIMSVVRKASKAQIATTVSGIIVGSGLAITGIALVPFTFGGSIAISALGGAVGAGTVAGGARFAAFIAARVLKKKKLKKTQQHINLDQQISLMINEEALEYNQMMTSAVSHVPQSTAASQVPESSASSLQGAAAIGRDATAGFAIAEGTAETIGTALYTAGPVAGMALAGTALAVTIPIDIDSIIYHSYNIHKAKNDPTGRTASNKAVKMLNNTIEGLLKGMCHAIDEVEYEVQTGKNNLRDDKCGYEIEVPVKDKEKFAVTVRTLFSGPFVYPNGYTLVSAVYDITMPELPQPATIKLEHCVDESDQTRPDLCFAIGSVDLKEKKITIKEVDQEFNESIQQKSSCLLCILHKKTLQNKEVVRYAAQCFYDRKYKNFWILNIVFTKLLSANFKYAQKRFGFEGSCNLFFFDSYMFSLDLTCFKDSHEFSGWMVSPNDDEEMPSIISMEDIYSAELREGSAKVHKKAFPSISLYVYIFDEKIATDEIDVSFKIGGTNLSININRQKE
ncbi:PREDICTED: uncharacterized protein LOC109582975 [Amphimedon queenslandica]|uniref:Caspase family p20 domain-containing protein n=1 Tax=Amphimedon queenslandica TaxID=400682 RepID=A0AAN0JA59_AMPQE|nr:PREDICTED: uncharacterized protein LOC109582975 [Amphimedon queenslandica]|eukprot:XP_019853637.1 PREDICTED: uncharacterized protein LOC109582975 [Amphimedon queenslandica]